MEYNLTLKKTGGTKRNMVERKKINKNELGKTAISSINLGIENPDVKSIDGFIIIYNNCNREIII